MRKQIQTFVVYISNVQTSAEFGVAGSRFQVPRAGCVPMLFPSRETGTRCEALSPERLRDAAGWRSEWKLRPAQHLQSRIGVHTPGANSNVVSVGV